jgi:uncharacterized protein involved in exopolysaccharide biosynthesis
MSDSHLSQVSKDEIFIRDIINFLIRSWKVIVMTSLVGLVCAACFIALATTQYEAVVNIQMTQISPNTGKNDISPLGVNLEEPSSLLARLKLPSSFNSKEFEACGVDQEKYPAESLISLLNFSLIRGASSLIELRIRAQSKYISVMCAQAIFENIRESQNLILKPYIDESKILLSEYRARLNEVKSQIAQADKDELAFSIFYLENRDDIKFLSQEIARLNAFILSGEVRQAKIIAPIYVSDNVTSPSKKKILLIGFLTGLFLGLLYKLISITWGAPRA